jgi:DNA polymerase-1
VPLRNPKNRRKGVRPPEPEEIEACRPYIEAEVLRLRPVFIVPLGYTSAKFFIPDAKAISGVRRKRWVSEFPSIDFRFGKLLKWLKSTDQMGLLPKDTHTQLQRRKAIERGEKHGFPKFKCEEFTVWPTFHPSYVLRGGGEEARQYILEDLSYLTKKITGEDQVPWDKYVLLDSLEKIKKVYTKIKRAYREGHIDFVALDTETTGLHSFLLPYGELLLFSLSDRPGRGYTVPFNHPESPFWKDTISLRAIIHMTNDLLATVPLVGHNLKFDIHWLNRVGIFPKKVAGDTYLAHWSLYNDMGEKNLETLATRYLGMVSHKDEMEQALLDLPPWLPIEGQYEQLTLDLTDNLSRLTDKKHNPWAIEVDADKVIYRERHMGDLDLFLVHRYCCADADSTGRLHEKLTDLLDEEGLLDPHERVTVPAILPTVEMERRGIKLDLRRFEQAYQEMQQTMDEVQQWFDQSYEDQVRRKLEDMPEVKKVPKEIKLSSPRNKRVWLFDILKCPVIRTTDAGAPSADKDVLNDILVSLYDKLDKAKRDSTKIEIDEKVKAIKELQRYNAAAKLNSSFLKPIPKYADLEDVAHAQFGIRTTDTGRYNCKGVPPWHGITRGSVTKECVIPLHDLGLILIADWSQQELRVLANYCGDEEMIKAFREGRDIHTLVTALCQGKDEKSVTSVERSSHKAVSLGVAIGGRGAAAVAGQLGISKAKAQKIIKKYLDTFPSVRRYHKQQEKQAQQDGEVWSEWGFRRILDKKKYDKDDLRRRGINNPIQMTAGDICTNALTMATERIEADDFKSSIWATIHDSICSSIYPGELLAYALVLKEIMEDWPSENLDWLRVPLAVDFDVGVSWGETLKMKLLGNGLVSISGKPEHFAKFKAVVLKWIPRPKIVEIEREDEEDDEGNNTSTIKSVWRFPERSNCE